MTYNPGDKIFAKVRGYPHWPCRINPLPKDVVVPKSKYPIFFYGTHEVYFLAKKDIFPYEKNKEKYGKRSTKAFQEGMDEIETNPDILLYGKDPQAEEFLLQFYDFECKSKFKTPDTSADFDMDNKITENPAKEPEQPAEASEPKCPDDVLDKTPVGVHEKTNSPEKELKETVENSDVKPVENSEQEQVETSEQKQVETSEQKQVETSEPKPVEDSPDEPVAALDQKLIETSKPKQTKISQPKPVKAVVEEKPKKLNALGRPIRKSASNFSAKKMVLGDDFVSSDDSDFNPLEHQPKKEDDEETTKEKEEKVLSPKKDVPKKIAEATTDAIPPPKKKPKVTSPKSPPIKKVKPFKKTPSVIKEPKMATTETTPLPVKDNQNHLNESKNLENETKLMILDRGIKSCLVLNQENFSACLLHMKNLETLQPSLLSLAKCYSIVLTIKKCRRYNRSSEIKLIAQQIFNNFLEIFTKSSKNEITEADREFQRRIDSVIKTGKGKDLPKCISELFSFQKLVSTPSIKKDTNDQQPNESSTILSSPPVPTENVANPVSPSPTKLSNVNSSSRPANSSAENKSESILMSGGNVMEAIKKAFIRQVVTKTLEDETQVNQEGASTNDLKNGAHETSCEADVPDNKSEDVKSPPNQNDSLNQMSSSPEVNQKSSTTKDSNSNTPKEEFHRPPSPLDVELMPKSPKTPSFEDCINPEPTQLEQMEMISNAKSVNVKVDRKRDRSPHALPHPIKHYKQCFLQALGVDPKTKDDQKKNHRDEAEKRTTPKALTNDPFTTPSPKIEKVEENDSPQKDYLDLDSRIANLFQISKKSDENSPVETGLKEIEKQPVENNLPPPPPPLQTSNIVLKARPQVTQGKTQNGFEYPPVDHRYQHIPSVPITPDSPPRSNVTQSPNNILNLLSHGITPSRAQNEITPTSPPRTGGPTQSLNGLIGLLGQSKRVQPVEKCPSTPEDVEVDNGVPSPEPTPNEPAGAKENTEISSPDHLVEDTKNLNGSSEVTPQTANTAY